MSFLSIQFAVFLAICVPAYCLWPARHRALFLLGASYVFYVLTSPVAAVGIFAATVFTYALGRALEKDVDAADPETGPRDRYVWLGVATLVAYLSFFKLMSPLRALLESSSFGGEGLIGFLSANAILPLGISYYTFKLISYLLDIYWGKERAERDFIRFATYVAFFPQIVAGPIQRSGDFLGQMQALSPSADKMRRGLRRLLLGCFKKAVVADNIAGYVAAYYPHKSIPEFSTLLAFYLFPAQMLADFSGLTDIAIGTGLLFGVESPENFDYPFAATNIGLYWRRWHMSLTTWLTDYVFTPLRMATRSAGNLGLAFSLIVNMVLIGIWHRVSWTFVVFGLLHGIFLVVDVLTTRSRAKFFRTHLGWDRAANLIGPIFTYHLVALAMVFVLAESLTQAWGVLTHLFARPAPYFGLLRVSVFHGPSKETYAGLLGLALWIVFVVAERRGWLKMFAERVYARWLLYYAVIWMIVKYGHNAENFIYYKF